MPFTSNFNGEFSTENTFQQMELNLEGETSIPDEIVNFRNIPIFVPNSLAGDYGKMRS